MTEQELANVIWDIKEIIRNLYGRRLKVPCFRVK